VADIADAGFQASQLVEHVLHAARFFHSRHAGTPLDAQHRTLVLRHPSQPPDVDLLAALQNRSGVGREDRAGEKNQGRDGDAEPAGRQSVTGVGGGCGL
jgi:hypothetical protein